MESGLLPDLGPLAWVLLAVAAVIVGLGKTAVPGATTIAVAIFAAVLPARQSTGTLLLLLIVADVFAVLAYRRHADWRALLRLAPAVIVGLGLGVVFLAFADDAGVKRVIGVILLVVIAITLLRRRMAPAVMSMYVLAARFSVKQFLGTAAWFFALVNLSKVPFSIGLGLITVPGVLLDLVLVPLVIAGALGGRWIADRIDQALFERLVIVFTIVGAVYLLI
jgi:uncharacterized membrane protein YfcA